MQHGRHLKMSVFKNIVQVIVSPRDGWEAVNISDTRTEDLISSVFYPLLAVLAISEFGPMMYDSTLTLSHTLVNAIASFAAFFFTFFITTQVMALAFPELVRTKAATDRLTDFVIYNMILILLVETISNLLPLDFMPLTILGLLYLPWVIFRGMTYLNLKGTQAIWSTILATILLIGLPLLLIKLVLMIINVDS